MQDRVLNRLIANEEKRQAQVLNLIASENYVSAGVRDALSSVFVNKYAEGYPKARYYGGNTVVDEVEQLAQMRALSLYKLSPLEWNVNVQPYSGSPANFEIYMAMVPQGGKIMGMKLDMGGHLTHGHHVSASGILWEQVPYAVDKKSEKLNYTHLKSIAKKEKPKMVVAGYTAYSRHVDFKQMRRVADGAKALLMVDMSHIAGLVAGGMHPSPFPHADIVMTTMHKTLRGPRAAIIFSRNKYSRAINRTVFPGIQGGPHIHTIAATAVALYEASRPEFKKYARATVANAKVLARSLEQCGWRIVSGGTETHLFLVNTWKRRMGGKRASNILEKVGIIVNKNAVPFDTKSPMDPSGIRLGTAALTTRGMREPHMKIIAGFIDQALRGQNMKVVAREVQSLAKAFPIK
jgi:glycine hydroxymethyltransferase